MLAVLSRSARLFQIHYPYPTDQDWTQARGLRYMALSILVGGWATFLFELISPLNPEHLIGSLAGMPLSFMRLCFVGLVVIVVANAALVRHFVEHSRLRAAGLSVVTSLYLVAVVSYLPNQPLGFVMLIFSLPVAAAGALLFRQETLVEHHSIVDCSSIHQYISLLLRLRPKKRLSCVAFSNANTSISAGRSVVRFTRYSYRHPG